MGSPSEQEAELQIFRTEISDQLSSWRKLKHINSRWDGGLTIATIVLTLTTTMIGMEGLSLNSETRKLLIGLCGGLVVAIQSIGNAFPVKQRAGSYRLLYAQGLALKSKSDYLQSADEIQAALPQMREEYYNLLVEASKVEA